MKLGDWIQVIFIIAKLTGMVDWSWWVVFLPLMITTFAAVLSEIIKEKK